LVLYFMVGLTLSTKSFFIFWAILVSTTMVRELLCLQRQPRRCQG
jgi:hypothetical protein